MVNDDFAVLGHPQIEFDAIMKLNGMPQTLERILRSRLPHGRTVYEQKAIPFHLFAVCILVS